MHGQISLEILAVVLMALLAFSAFSLIASNTQQTQHNITLQNQLWLSARQVGQNLASLAILSDASSGTVLTIPTRFPQTISRTFEETCTITFITQGGVSFVQAQWDTQSDGVPEFSSEYQVSIPNAFDIPSTPINCGSDITVTRV